MTAYIQDGEDIGLCRICAIRTPWREDYLDSSRYRGIVGHSFKDVHGKDIGH